MSKERDELIKSAKEWYKDQDYSPEFPLFKIMADFYTHKSQELIKQNEELKINLNRPVIFHDCEGGIIRRYPTVVCSSCKSGDDNNFNPVGRIVDLQEEIKILKESI